MIGGASTVINLLKEIEALKQQQRQIMAEAEKKCKALQNAEYVLRNQNEACWYCGGTGKILRTRVCAEDDRPDPNDPNDYHICTACKGTGHKRWQNEKGEDCYS